MSLFREEVQAERANRLFGEVVIGQPYAYHLLAALLGALIVAAAIWLSVNTYARVETVPGILATDRPTAKVFPPRVGVAARLHVADGQAVVAGQPLVSINADTRNAQGVDTAAASAVTVQEQLGLAQHQIALVNQGFALEGARLQDVIVSGESQLEGLEQQAEVQAEIVASQRQLFDQAKAVVEKGFISRNDFERRRQTYLSSTQQELDIRQRIARLRSEIAQARSQLRNVDVARSREVGTISSSLRTLEQQRLQYAGAQSILVTAPIAGRIATVQTGLGQTVQPTMPMFIIVPENAYLHAEVYAPTRAIGLVRVGQKARLGLDAFPYQRFGTAEGRIVSVSRVALDPREITAPFSFEEPVYRVVIALDSQIVQARGERLPLQPGMTLRASLILERQSFLDWLLAPLNAVTKRT